MAVRFSSLPCQFQQHDKDYTFLNDTYEIGTIVAIHHDKSAARWQWTERFYDSISLSY